MSECKVCKGRKFVCDDHAIGGPNDEICRHCNGTGIEPESKEVIVLDKLSRKELIAEITHLQAEQEEYELNLSSLRAKLDEKEKILNLANQSLKRVGSATRFSQHIEIPEDALVFKDTEETLRADDDNEPAYSTKQWNELQAKLEAAEKEKSMWFKEYSKSADNETVLFEQALTLKKERDDLQRQVTRLEETDRHREFCMVEMAQKIAEYEHQEGVEVAFVLDRYKEHRDYVIGLEATIAQMRGAMVINTAKLYIGVPFVWDGTSPSGFDCSGYTQYVMRENGIPIPRTAVEQYSTGTPVDKANMKAGDIVFFTTYKPGATHVGIYIGEDKFIHATQIPEPGQVAISLLTEPYYAERYIGARRYICGDSK